jgi:uncharacterized protein (TIGR02001 family)
MLNRHLKFTVLATLSGAALLAHGAQAGVSGNIGLASNYIWRGVTQTSDQAAISGGLDYASDFGFYAGTWASNVNFGNSNNDKGYELDLYGGFSGDLADFSYDLGTIYYAFPVQDDLNLLEVFVSGGYGPVGAGVYYTVDKDGDSDKENDLYYTANLSFDLDFLSGFNLGLVVGHYDFDAGSNADYTHYGLSLGKDIQLGAVTLAVDKNDTDDNDPRLTVSWAVEFDV